MEILTVLGMLLLLLVISVGSLLRYWFIRGRLRGMQEAAAETIRGIHSHFEVEGQLPPGVSKTLEKLKTAAGSLSHHKQLELRHAQLWMFDEGNHVCMAHVGFQHMMPNYRGFEPTGSAGKMTLGTAPERSSGLKCLFLRCIDRPTRPRYPTVVWP